MNHRMKGCITFLACLFLGSQASARNCSLSNGEITDTDYCLASPEYTKSTIYEIGICDAAPTAPTSGVAADFTNCTTVFENSAGTTVTITDTSRSALSGDFFRPAFDTYTHGYVIISPSNFVRGEFTFDRAMSDNHGNSGEVCWTKAGTIWRYDNANSDYTYCGSVSSDKGDTEIRFNSFDDNGVFLASGTNGNKSFYLLTSDQKLSGAPSSLTSYGDVDTVLVTIDFDTDITIDEKTSGVELGIKKLNSAFVGISSTNPNLVWQIRPGDISLEISTY